MQCFVFAGDLVTVEENNLEIDVLNWTVVATCTPSFIGWYYTAV